MLARMGAVAVRILHRPAQRSSGPLERWLGEIRLGFARAQAERFGALGTHVVVDEGASDDTSFGARLRAIAGGIPTGGLVVLGSGSVPLATERDLAAFVSTAASPDRRALANNRYSADIVGVAGAYVLRDLPDLPSDNGLPRWLEEVAGYRVDDLRRRWRLGIDLDSPLDVVLIGAGDARELAGRARERLAAIARVARDRRAELLVSGRTSAATLGWLERSTATRVRAFVEERGLRGSSRLVAHPGDPIRSRPPGSLLGALLERDGPEAIGARLADLADAAVVDTRVLLAHRLGPDEATWPSPEDRFASDLLLAERIVDPWLRALTTAAAEAPIPVALGGHTLVGPGLRLVLGRRWR
jgi:hypothetical protein